MHRTKAERRNSERKAKRHKQQVDKLKKEPTFERKGHDDIPDWDTHWASGLSLDAIRQRLEAEESESRRTVLPPDSEGRKGSKDLCPPMVDADDTARELSRMAIDASGVDDSDDWTPWDT